MYIEILNGSNNGLVKLLNLERNSLLRLAIGLNEGPSIHSPAVPDKVRLHILKT